MRNATWIACTFALMAGAPAAAQSDPSTSGPLYDELARLDSVLFDAAFVTCSAEKAISFFTDDVEFYDDQSGFESGQQVRDSFKRLKITRVLSFDHLPTRDESVSRPTPSTP